MIFECDGVELEELLQKDTLRLRRSNSDHNALIEDAVDEPDADQQANIIVREMEQHQRLMEDNPVSEELRREALRDLPQGLTMKRHVRAKLSASVSLRSKRRPISFLKRLKYRLSFAWKRSKDKFRDFVFSIELWYEAIRNIEGNFGSAVASYFYFLRWLFAVDVVVTAFVVVLVVVPQAMHDQGETTRRRWGVLDFISGTGAYEDSLLFYGHYHDCDVSNYGPLSYNMPFAYFFTMVCLYLAVFTVLCFKTAYSYRRNFISAGGLKHALAGKLFCGWDFGVASPRAAGLCAAGIYLEFKELLNEQNKKQCDRSCCRKVGECLVNVAVSVLAVGLGVGLQWAVWLLLRSGSFQLAPALAVTGALALLPAGFHLLVRMEYYKPRTAVYVTLARTWLLDVGTLMMVFYFWSNSATECWETSFGQEAYRLVLLDCLVSLILLPSIEFFRGLLFKLHVTKTAPEFNIAYNSLTLIYNQAVLWFGLMFSPLLAVAVTLKFLFLFYVKRECALRACQPARKIWRASQTQTVLYMLVTLSLFTTLFGFGSLFFRTSSVHCGPFRGYDYVYEVLSEGVLRLSHHEVALQAILFVTRPGFIAFVMLFLCVAVYYMRAKGVAQNAMVEILRHMLVLQSKDKDFLLTAISKVSKGEWMYSPRPESEGPDSHTWKYLNEVRKPSNSGFHFDASRLSHSFNDRPRSYAKENRPNSHYTEKPKSSDGETDSSFSWQGSSNYLNQKN